MSVCYVSIVERSGNRADVRVVGQFDNGGSTEKYIYKPYVLMFNSNPSYLAG
jgi:hypothetical protein